MLGGEREIKLSRAGTQIFSTRAFNLIRRSATMASQLSPTPTGPDFSDSQEDSVR